MKFTYPELEAAAKAAYEVITAHAAVLQPGADFMTWENLPDEQRTMQLASIRAALNTLKGERT